MGPSLQSCLPALRRNRAATAPPPGFTLVEIMIVVAILGIVLATGMPSIVRSLQTEPLRQAVRDTVEALSQARAQAILAGVPAQMVLQDADGPLRLSVVTCPLTPRRSNNPEKGPDPAAAPEGFGATNSMFSAVIPATISMPLLELNMRSQMAGNEVRVHFYPNGTCEDFTIILDHPSGTYKIATDPITGIAEAERIR